MYHLLILWRQLAIGTIGSHCRPVLQIDIKGFQCFDHCLTEGHLRGTPWSLVGKPRREQTSGQTIKGHAADMSKPIEVLEPRDHGVGVLREHRRLQLAQRIQCLLAHVPIAVDGGLS